MNLGRWLISFAALFVFSLVLGWFDNTTELRPTHDRLLQSCFAIAILSGLICGYFAIPLSKLVPAWRRPMFVIAFAFVGSISVFLVLDHATSIAAGGLDFPSDKTRNSTTLLSVSRAYRTHGKGAGWHIQTMPLWADLNINEDDYNFMLAQRPQDSSRQSDEISSRGYFCAHVSIQQSGTALRVMNAGTHTLPRGTIVVCPAGVSRRIH